MKTLSLFPNLLTMITIDEPEMNADIKRILMQEASDIDSRDRSNIGGWHSGPLVHRSEECFKKLKKIKIRALRDIVAERAEEYKPLWNMDMWAIVNSSGDYNMPHTHPKSDMSSVYYVDVGNAEDDKRSGAIVFLDPRGGIVNMSQVLVKADDFYRRMYGGGNIETIKPHTGLLLLFPSWLTHSVLPYQGSEPRIAVAANYAVDSFKT